MLWEIWQVLYTASLIDLMTVGQGLYSGVVQKTYADTKLVMLRTEQFDDLELLDLPKGRRRMMAD